ncbi:MAG TPA: Gfo/Idh/MocA family oxidoreductase [Candidatus Limnocylindria bacterium]|nr:Gfo/Idh/MocA family oxidoreductase [Candidatus Limnocylindria bacterium]
MRVALLGVGRLGAAHAATLAGLGEVSELRVHDADAARARDVAEAVHATVAGSVDDALRAADAAVIVTPTPTHAPIIKRCVDLGLATFCEKPIATSLEETKDVVAHADRANARLQIGFQRRFDAGYRRAKDDIRAGRLGTVYSFTMTSCDREPPPDAYIETSGGQFKDQMIHDFDITRWLFEDEADEVYATGSTLGQPQYESFGDVNTSAVVMRLRRGIVGLVMATRENRAGYDIHVEIHGAKDTVAIGLDRSTPMRSVERDAPRMADPAYPGFIVRFADAYREELAHFLRFARGEADNACTAKDALEALRLAEAAGRSLREQRPVRLVEVPA